MEESPPPHRRSGRVVRNIGHVETGGDVMVTVVGMRGLVLPGRSLWTIEVQGPKEFRELSSVEGPTLLSFETVRAFLRLL